MSADACQIGVLTADGQQLMLLMGMGQTYWPGQDGPVIALESGSGLVNDIEAGAVIALGKPHDNRGLLAHTNLPSGCALPLTFNGRTQGVVVLAHIGVDHKPSPRAVDLARTLIAQAAVALENAMLVADLESSLAQLRDAQARMMESERLSAMGELAAAVAHQINNPLTTIVLDAELLALSEPGDTERSTALTAIVRAGKRAAGVVRRLLNTTRGRNISAVPEPMDVVMTIQETVDLVAPYIERNAIALEWQRPSETLPPVMAEPGDLTDVWLNLLLNAHDAVASKRDGLIQIDIQYKIDESRIEVIISDNGIGIPAAILNDIFRPFFTTKPVGEGTGLGLHICKQVMERIGGTIEVQSVEGQGSTFYVRLPIIKGEG
jgi:signal transduction histidine kinase